MAASLFTASHAQAQRVGIKTNLLYDATTTINLGVEVGVAKKLTLDLSGNLNLWDWKNNMKWKHWMVQPELRFWTCQRFNGHFFGVHALAAQYNVGNLPIPRNLTFLGMDIGSLATTRYEGWAFGAGLAYGYALPLSKHWNLKEKLVSVPCTAFPTALGATPATVPWSRTREEFCLCSPRLLLVLYTCFNC